MALIHYIVKNLFSPLFYAAILGIAIVTAVYFYYLPQIPSVAELRNTQLNLPLRVYSKDDQLIAEFGEYRRRPITYDEVPDDLRNAFIAIEDSRFYDHKGIDFRGIARAIVSAFKSGRVTQGASTITMQVARNFFLNNDRTLDRKLREAILALRIEDELDKEEILELYLNKIFLGKRSYGVGSAAEIYYGKKMEDLTLAQSAMIAGLPKAPSKYNPIKNPKRAKIRRDYILKRMFELDYITESAYQTALDESLSATIHNVESETYAPYMAEMARTDAIKRFGEENIYKLGLKIYTTLDSAEQENAISTLRNNLLKYTKRHGYRGPEDQISLDSFKSASARQTKLKEYKTYARLFPAVVTSVSNKEAILDVYQESKPVKLNITQMSWARKYISENKRGKKPKKANAVLNVGDIVRVEKDDKGIWNLSQLPKVSGALVSMNPKNGAIEAIAGGFDFTYSKFNRALQAKRQPGSSFKPFIYAAALEKGLSPATTIEDKALELENSTWEPKNYGHEEGGPTRLREALAKSKNLVSIRLLQEIGLGYAMQYAKRFGFKKRALPADLTLSLGTGSTTPLEIATAYSSFANGGYKVESHFIRKIMDKNDNVIFEADPITVCPSCLSNKQNSEGNFVSHPAKRIMTPQVHYQITSMLQSVAQSGTAAKTNRLKRSDLAGKTGTTDDQKDAWFAGFTPEKVATVWVGFDQIAPLGKKETAAGAALPIWMDFMKTALEGTKQKGWKVPRGLIDVQLDSETGMPPNEYTLETIIEKLTPDQIPTEEEILAYMAKYRDDLIEQQELKQLENLEGLDEVTRQRQLDRIRREAAQREENARRREQARQREVERLRNLGIEPPASLLPPQAQAN